MQPVVSRGFTLVEAMATMLIFSIAALALTNVLGFSLRHQSDGMVTAKVINLAQSYFEEIAARRFDENTPLGGVPPCSPATTPCSTIGIDGESRATFDDIDDYHGLDESPPLDSFGDPRPDYQGYRVQIAVSYPTPAQVTDLALDQPTDAKIVRLDITTPAGKTQQFATIKGNF